MPHKSRHPFNVIAARIRVVQAFILDHAEDKHFLKRMMLQGQAISMHEDHQEAINDTAHFGSVAALKAKHVIGADAYKAARHIHKCAATQRHNIPLRERGPRWIPKVPYDESPVLPIVSFSTGLNADAEVFTPLGVDQQLQYFTTPQLEVPQVEVVLDYLLAGTSATPSVPTLEALPMAMTSTLSLDDPEGWSNLAKDMMWQIANLYNKIDELKAKYDPLDVLESMATLETRLKLLENDERTHHMKLTAHVANLASDIEIMDGLFLAHGLSGTTQACPAPAYLDDATVAGLRDRLDAVEIVASETKAVDQRLVLLSREIGAIRDDLDEHIITTDVSFRTCGEQWRESAKRTEIKERNIRTAIDELATRVSAFDMIDYAHMVEVVAPFLNQLPKRPVPDLLSSIDAISLMKADISQLSSNILNIRASVNAITEESDERFSRCADGTVVDEKFVILRSDISSTLRPF